MRWSTQNHRQCLYILTEHDFQDAFKNGRSVGSAAYAWKGTTSRVIMGSKYKISFWLDGSTSSGKSWMALWYKPSLQRLVQAIKLTGENHRHRQRGHLKSFLLFQNKESRMMHLLDSVTCIHVQHVAKQYNGKLIYMELCSRLRRNCFLQRDTNQVFTYLNYSIYIYILIFTYS
jgi:hypothetical protein